MTLRIALFTLLTLAMVGQAAAQQVLRADSSPGALVVRADGTSPGSTAPTTPANAAFSIEVIEPLVRGIRVVTSQEMMTVKGRVLGEVSDLSVLINGQLASVAADNSFEASVRFAVGASDLMIIASNGNGQTISESFKVDRVDTDIPTGTYRAIVVGIDTYEGAWPSLRNAARDARAVAEVLESSYGFVDIDTLYNERATRTNIINAFEQMAGRAQPDDRVMIYFSGHGQLDERFNRGYWVPANARTISTANFISNSNVVDYVGGIPSKHTLLVTDACFAGDIFRGPSSVAGELTPERMIVEAMRSKSRTAMTSGGIEPVMDGGRDGHSVFAYYFLKALKENTETHLLDSAIFARLQNAVVNNSEQSPQFSVLKNTGDEGGSFVFTRIDR